MAFKEYSKDTLVYTCSDIIPAKHVFTTRLGGVSVNEFATLNLGSLPGEKPESVRENYRRVCALIGAGPDDCAVTKQVHGNEVRIVTGADRHVPGELTPYEADGIVTAEKGLPLFCFAADCVTVLMCDVKNSVAAAVHCGWRSSVADILGVAIGKMVSLGADINEIRCAMGPAIGACCFETDGDVPEAIGRYIGAEAEGCFIRREDGKYLVDLRLANKLRLLQLGVPEENIDCSGECTVCLHDKYFSHRYTKGKRGIHGAVIVL